MNKKMVSRIVGAFGGLIIGGSLGAYIGLVLGGTFLGSFDIYESTGFEGYELAAYGGVIFGAIFGAQFGMKLSKRKNTKK